MLDDKYAQLYMYAAIGHCMCALRHIQCIVFVESEKFVSLCNFTAQYMYIVHYTEWNINDGAARKETQESGQRQKWQ